MTADVTKRRDRSSNNTKERRTIAYTKDGKVSDVTRFLLTVCSFFILSADFHLSTILFLHYTILFNDVHFFVVILHQPHPLHINCHM